MRALFLVTSTLVFLIALMGCEKIVHVPVNPPVEPFSKAFDVSYKNVKIVGDAKAAKSASDVDHEKAKVDLILRLIK